MRAASGCDASMITMREVVLQHQLTAEGVADQDEGRLLARAAQQLVQILDNPRHRARAGTRIAEAEPGAIVRAGAELARQRTLNQIPSAAPASMTMVGDPLPVQCR
jgi:hypothetical protein